MPPKTAEKDRVKYKNPNSRKPSFLQALQLSIQLINNRLFYKRHFNELSRLAFFYWLKQFCIAAFSMIIPILQYFRIFNQESVGRLQTYIRILLMPDTVWIFLSICVSSVLDGAFFRVQQVKLKSPQETSLSCGLNDVVKMPRMFTVGMMVVFNVTSFYALSVELIPAPWAIIYIPLLGFFSFWACVLYQCDLAKYTYYVSLFQLSI